MSSCIYCGAPAHSLEHVIPAAFGEFVNAPNLQDRLCRDCNIRLGLLDEQLSRCGPEAILRRFYNLRGRKSHDAVNPFSRGSAQGKRIELSGWDESQGIEVNLEIVDGIVRQLLEITFVETSASGKTFHLPLRKGMSATQLLTVFAELKVVAPFDTHISFDPQEREWVEKLIREVWPAVSIGASAPMSTEYEGAVSKHTVTDRYFRAFAKVGFHYFLTQFPQYMGHELVFSDIRKCIFEDATGPIPLVNNFVVLREAHLFKECLDPDGRPPQGAQIAFRGCWDCAGRMSRAWRLFVTGDWPAPTYTIRLAQDFTVTERKAAGHAYCYYPGGEQGNYSGEAYPLNINTSVGG